MKNIKSAKAIMYGAGNIGRGFIGALLSQTGYEVTFIDIAQDVVDMLCEENKYPVRIVSDDGAKDEWIESVTAINGNDTEAVAKAIAECEIMATAVGARILPYIVPNLVAGIRKRFEQGGGALDILICENLMHADSIVKGLIKEKLTDEESERLERLVGFVETSIGRMVPVQTPEMKDGHPLRVCVENYGFLPVDKVAFKGEVPDNPRLKPFTPFDFYIKRKLFLHNMGHATCAYLGSLKGYTYIHEAIKDTQIRVIVENAMEESCLALSCEYSVPQKDLTLHKWDLINRFSNSALGDTCARVGGDARRKLGASDRLIGSTLLMIKNDIIPSYVLTGIAAAIFALSQELQSDEEAIRFFKDELLQTDEKTMPIKSIMQIYEAIKNGEDLSEIEKQCASIRVKSLNNIV